MFRRISVLLAVFLLVFTVSCSQNSYGAGMLCKNIASSFECTLNITDESGDALFGGKLSHGENGYEFTVGFPEEIAGTVYRVSESGVEAEVFGKTVTLCASAAEKLCDVFSVLDGVSSPGKDISPYKAELYGAECGLCGEDGRLLYFSHGVPLLVIAGGVRAEFTGFSQ